VATLLQLQSEPWWNEESVPPTLNELAIRLRAALHVPADSVGIRGNTSHLRGYHRSAAWVLNSSFCTDRSYSVSETAGNRFPQNFNWACAIDVGGMSQENLLAMCQRVDKAVRSGQFEKITEWYGNINGDQRVDGYDNIRNILATSDSSHLVHLHLSFDRQRVREDHSDVFAMLMGVEMELTDKLSNGYTVNNALVTLLGRSPTNLTARLDAIDAALGAIKTAIAGMGINLTPEQLAVITTAAHDGAISALDGVTVTSKIDKAP
jgi:hypothetical protein